MRYLGIGDLYNRDWIYTDRGIRKMVLHKDFPKPVFIVDGGRTKIWRAIDIEDYEAENPRLFSQTEKVKYVRKYAIGQLLKKG